MKNRQYEETLAQLYQMLPMYQREGKKAMKKGLDNILDLCWEMGLPQWKFNSIHVAGTNGKGSVSAMIASVLQEAGFKVGMYTSPHLLEFTERIRINGKEIPQEAVVEFVDAYASV
ncbi:MAG: bifunctional folylpolyglutamate synthase/dihydrofolate synthase, partial [Bacteroidota bacterium]